MVIVIVSVLSKNVVRGRPRGSARQPPGPRRVGLVRRVRCLHPTTILAGRNRQARGNYMASRGRCAYQAQQGLVGGLARFVPHAASKVRSQTDRTAALARVA